MSIISLLKDKADIPLLNCRSGKWSKRGFVELVENFQIQLIEKKIQNKFILIAEKDPAFFYALTFSVWKSGGRVIFPNRNILDNELSFPYFDFKITVDNSKLLFSYNKSKKNITNISQFKNPDAIVFSSGSTGEPKGIIHSKENLMLNAIASAKKLSLITGPSVTYLNPYLMSAFSHFLVHHIRNAELIFQEMDEMTNLSNLYNQIPSLSLVGSPMHIISARKYIPKNATPKIFMSSGDFIYPDIIKNIISSFPMTTYYYVYGLAELGGRFFINKIDKNVSFEKYSLIGENIENTEVILNNGELLVSSPSLFYGYIVDGKIIKSHLLHPTGDLFDSSSNNLKLLGRKDDEIKIGGNKISLKNLEQKSSKAFPDDLVIFVRAKHEVLGSLIAFIIQSKLNYTRTELLNKLRAVLKVEEMPHLFYKIDKIPYTQTMKIDRNWISNNLTLISPIT